MIRLLLCAAAALYWELVLIRWLGACVRIVAYYSNFVLITAFFGLGAGALLARRGLRLDRFVFPAIAVTLLLGVLLSGTQHLNPQSVNEFIWQAAPRGVPNEQQPWVSVWVVLPAVYLCSALVFFCFGQWLGRLFAGLRPLWAYSVEICGSVLGILGFAALAYAGTDPLVWFGVGFVLLLPLLERKLAVLALAAASAALVYGFAAPLVQQFTWSPYYKIATQPLQQINDARTGTVVKFSRPVGHILSVNNDYHQLVLDLRAPTRPEHPFLRDWRQMYEAPYRDLDSLPPGPILVVGAGTGNDVSAALRRTKREIHAVEIDPEIVKLGRRLHAERPYDDPRVTLTVDDARSFFQRTKGRYALVVFGFLDSHTLLSSFSSVRLDNFVYTKESLEQVKRILHPGGKVALTFAANRHWIRKRIQRIVEAAFDRPARVSFSRQSFANGVLFEAYRPAAPTSARGALAPDDGLPLPEDDWPYLYLQHNRIPGQYWGFLALVVALGFLSLLFLPRGQRRLRLPYFFLGAAFFLLETSNVIRLSMLYGSTWSVNVLVFTGILVLILLGNLTCHRLGRIRLELWFALLVLSIAVAYLTPTASLLAIDAPVLRVLAAVGSYLGPVYFASIIFASLIKDETELYQAYGSNVLGAVVGGSCEYLSLILGFKFLLGVALLFYLVVFVLVARGRPPRARA